MKADTPALEEIEVERLFGREILVCTPERQVGLVEAARSYWRSAGFPYPSISASDTRREVENLIASDRFVNGRAGGLLSTVGVRLANTCHPQIWHIKARGRSCVDVFADDRRLAHALSKAPRITPNRRCWNAQSVRGLMRISHKMRPSNFRPVVARQLIRAFSETSACVLDFSAGFGGRLLGAVSLDRKYIGIDPADEQVAGLNRLFDEVRAYVPGRAEIHKACAEDMLPDLASGSMSLVFSSPPYFDRERYSDDVGQSYVRYPDILSWSSMFLCRILVDSARILKSGGVLLLNVTDRADLNLSSLSTKFCDGYLELVGCIPYQMPANPVKCCMGTVKEEPILVFQKPPLDRRAIEQKIEQFGGNSLPLRSDAYTPSPRLSRFSS